MAGRGGVKLPYLHAPELQRHAPLNAADALVENADYV